MFDTVIEGCAAVTGGNGFSGGVDLACLRVPGGVVTKAVPAELVDEEGVFAYAITAEEPAFEGGGCVYRALRGVGYIVEICLAGKA